MFALTPLKTNNGKIKANKRNFSYRLFADNGNFS